MSEYVLGKCLDKKIKKTYFERGSNSRPSACKADVITTTPSKLYDKTQYMYNLKWYVALLIILMVTYMKKVKNIRPIRGSNPWP